MSDFLFCDDDDSQPEEMLFSKPAWKVLIIDDEPDVHEITKLVLNDFQLDDRRLDFYSAHSAAEAKELLKQHDFCVAFVDVVMETSHAGLDLIKYIRKDLNDHIIRLVLRTGQPGEAPESSVIREYDINDYKHKTELTDRKLTTLMFSTLRSYRDIVTIEKHKTGLERIINATINFLDCNTITEFASAVLSQVANVLGISDRKILCCAAVSATDKPDVLDLDILAVSDESVEDVSQASVPSEINELFVRAHNERCSIHSPEHFVGYFITRKGLENLLYVSHGDELTPEEHDILEFFTNNIAVAYDNIRMREVVKSSQKELSYILGEAVERRSKETGSHVKRVANYSYMLATYIGLGEYTSEQIKLASPLHDVGKIGIPDKILNKPAKLDEQEWEVMKTHAQLGYDILSQSQNEILQLGAKIAQQHHEKYDGSGYPLGLKGKHIDIVGRITALADVFDALASSRCYKPAWPLEKVLDLLEKEKGKHFDPELVDILLENLDEFLAIRDAFPDPDMEIATGDLENR
ncbi:DUF3369 domain-containing protein [Flocculibacter collagenilyticus]|uniref:DUF3369 domain-containing protein n=1 Tax=Flocculibacter collagenilyticus TaxID=2744479 RepID=UPI001F481AEE|nr:DUF3369 domain-containing protein [Flocculibacter collagenilyticus]